MRSARVHSPVSPQARLALAAASVGMTARDWGWTGSGWPVAALYDAADLFLGAIVVYVDRVRPRGDWQALDLVRLGPLNRVYRLSEGCAS